MSIQVLVPIISKAIGRDIGPDVDLFYRSRAAVGSALNQQGQQFFVQNWRGIADFMYTPAGKAAVAQFMNSWAASLLPKTMAADPEAPPVPIPALEMPEAASLLGVQASAEQPAQSDNAWVS